MPYLHCTQPLKPAYDMGRYSAMTAVLLQGSRCPVPGLFGLAGSQINGSCHGKSPRHFVHHCFITAQYTVRQPFHTSILQGRPPNTPTSSTTDESGALRSPTVSAVSFRSSVNSGDANHIRLCCRKWEGQIPTGINMLLLERFRLHLSVAPSPGCVSNDALRLHRCPDLVVLDIHPAGEQRQLGP